MTAAAAAPTAAPIVLFGGKGGVGKTTLAAAWAGLLAAQGHRTLLVSTDPAHSTGDVLGTALGNRPRRVRGDLWAVEVDATADAETYVSRIEADAAATVSPEVLPTVRRHLRAARSAPGTLEAALLDRFADLVASVPGDWDRIVFDTAPTGHTLRLLALPELLTEWVEGMVRARERVNTTDRFLRNLAGDDSPPDDAVVRRLRERRDRLRVTRERLRTWAAVWLVLIPERLPIEETARALDGLEDAGIPVAGLVVNRVLPEEPDSPFLRARAAQQRSRMAEISRRFPRRPVLTVPWEPTEIDGPESLGRIADHIREAVGLG